MDIKESSLQLVENPILEMLSFSTMADDESESDASAGDSSNEEEPCPRDFWLTRAAARVLVRGWVVSALAVAGLVNLLINVGCPQFSDGFEACSLADAEPLAVVEWACYGACVLALVGAPAALRCLLVGPPPTGGALEHLGAQAQWNVLASPRGQLLVVSMARGYQLRRWAQLLSLFAVPAAAGCIVFFACMVVSSLFGRNWLAAAVWICWLAVWGVAMPLAVAWYLTLKQGAALAVHEVRAVRCAIQRCPADSPEWEADVVQGTKALAQRTLPALSAGWATGAAAVCVAVWALSLGHLANALRRPLDDLGKPPLENPAFWFLAAAFWACIPMLVLWDLADASSECDLLMKDLNGKRLADTSNATHITIFKLETMLGQLNKNQGLGFVLGGIVVDKRYFSALLLKLGALATTILTTLLAYRHAAQRTTTEGDGCRLTQEQQAAVKADFVSFNVSCVWNVTVDGAALF